MSIVIELRPGDVIQQAGVTATYISQVVHPLWPDLQLVTWFMSPALDGPYGPWSFDALSPAQEIGFVVPSTEEVREARLRKILLAEEMKHAYPNRTKSC